MEHDISILESQVARANGMMMIKCSANEAIFLSKEGSMSISDKWRIIYIMLDKNYCYLFDTSIDMGKIVKIGHKPETTGTD